MMLELNSKPKMLIIQRHTKANKWLTEAVMTKDEVLPYADKDGNVVECLPSRTFSLEEVYYYLEMFKTPMDEFADVFDTNVIRILNEYDKVILSTASHDFLIAAGRSGHITVRREIETEDGGKAYVMETYSKNNKAYPHIREFQRFIGKHGGIKRVVRYPRDEHDGWEQVWKVHFKDGTSVTVGTHHLYMMNGKIVSQFASDVVNV